MTSTAAFSSPHRTPAEVAAALAGDGVALGPWRPLTRTLLDTFDGRLHAAGLRLELRRSDRTTLVLTGPGGVPAHVPVDGAPRVAADLPPGPFRARLAGPLDVRALLPLVEVTSRRAEGRRRNASGAAVVAVAVDDHLAVGGEALDPPWAVEVTELGGFPKPAARLRDHLDRLGLSRLAGDALDLALAAAGVDPAGVRRSPTVPLEPATPALPGFRAVLANLAAAVEANWQGTIDDVDPEFLHDLRVAVRRTRSVLAQGRRVVPGEVRDRYREGFGWLGGITGPARDLDVYVLEWERYVAPLAPDAVVALDPVLAHLERRRRAEHRALARALRSARARTLVDGWRAWLGEEGRPGGSGHGGAGGRGGAAGGGRDAALPLGRVVADRVGDAQGRLLARGRAIGPETPGEELHELRKDAKKLRYLLECFGGLMPAGPHRRLVQRLKALQDNLGAHQDAEVHAAQLAEVSAALHGAGASSDTLLAMGRLTEHLAQRRRQMRAEFAARFADYDTGATRRALAELLEGSAP